METTERTYTQAELNEACQVVVERTLQNAREGRIPGVVPVTAMNYLRQALALAETTFKDACEAAIAGMRTNMTEEEAGQAMRELVTQRVNAINDLIAHADALDAGVLEQSQHGVAEAEAAAQIMLMLGPLVADAALVGKTYGWDDVLRIVSAAAMRLKGFVIPEDGWTSIAIQMAGGTDYKSANRHYGQLEGQIVRVTKQGYLPRDYKVLEVGARDDDDDTKVGFLLRPTDDNGEEMLGEPDELVGYEEIDAIAVY